MPNFDDDIDTVRASRAGHTFHERWAARRALQLVFPNDKLVAIAVEGISSTETATPGVRAEEVADLVLYYGQGETFNSCDRLETVQFKYKLRDEPVTAAYLKKTVEKFADTILGYEKDFSSEEVDRKVCFTFVTNSKFSESLWQAIEALIYGTVPTDPGARTQVRSLKQWCIGRGLADARRLFSRIVFRAGEKSLSGLDNALRRSLTDWSAGADPDARARLFSLQDLVLKKAGPSGQSNNLIRREDVLDALDCEPDDLFPAEAQFIDVGKVVERTELAKVIEQTKSSTLPLFVHADGGVGKTVFVQSFASRMASEYEVIVFDCFGGGRYRSDSHSRHLPRIGLVQIVNELASRTLCDPMLPGSDDSRKIIKATRKRLAQAAAAVRTQSEKLGLVIVIDASDNAQLEADYRHEDAFPKLLLAAISEDPIDGVKLLLTARTHRKESVISRSTVQEVELGPFTHAEAVEFLSDRRPDATEVEITTAMARSGRNARILDYLVQTWGANVQSNTSPCTITVKEIIAQRCNDIINDLHTLGWASSDITEFFVALSLLPPPIPLQELAIALGWSAAQVKTAAIDLAPMLELTSHGAIFRDEPTETYVRETFANQRRAQESIADRLISSQEASGYAAEALPHFLVVIKDSDRAFSLADSTSFPVSVKSEFGRRRLTLARLRAAFRLATFETDFDRVLSLSMRLSQVTTANMRGDEFIRSSPALAILLGDRDSYRRLFADRSGWRGGRSARLTVAHRFAGDFDESAIQCESTIRWIRWFSTRSRESEARERQQSGPEIGDFSAVLFHNVAESKFDVVDSNLARWNRSFSLSASDELLDLLAKLDLTQGTSVVADFVSFASSDQCNSLALKLQFLSRATYNSRQDVRRLAKAVMRVLKSSKFGESEEEDRFQGDREKNGRSEIVNAALASLLYGSRSASAAIIRLLPSVRPSAYDYSERYGRSGAWGAILNSCVAAWSAGRAIAYHDLLPKDVKITRRARAISSKVDVTAHLKELRTPRPAFQGERGDKRRLKRKFEDRECEQIAEGIELVIKLVRPVETDLLSGNGLTSSTFNNFLEVWGAQLQRGGRWNEDEKDLLIRTVGLGCACILLNHADFISPEQGKKLVSHILQSRFFLPEKFAVLRYLAVRPNLHELAGTFAQHIAEQVRSDDDVSQRGKSYVELAESILPMSVDEARSYYQQGLGQLDQMGGESYDQIYSLLNFASAQQGGFVTAASAQRLMNLCQTIVNHDSGKFGWTLFAKAAAKSIGLPAIAKLIRWHDQEVAHISYGLPQLACFLAIEKQLDPRRAAFFLNICEDHGWHDWRSGDGVASLLELSSLEDQRRIFRAVVTKLHAETPFGGWTSLWESYIETAKRFSGAIADHERQALELHVANVNSRRQAKEANKRQQQEFLVSGRSEASVEEIERLISTLVSQCDQASPGAIDQAFKIIRTDERLRYGALQRFIVALRAACPYSKRLQFLFAVCEASEIGLRHSLEILVDCFADWCGSSANLSSNACNLIERLFISKSSELFENQFSSVERDISQMAMLCGDKRFVLQLVLRQIAVDEVELDGDEWLQVATALCGVTSGAAARDALEMLLSGPASRIADEIGEGPHRPEQEICSDESGFFADVVWHLLGDEDGYVRWPVARGISTLVELKLGDDLLLLLERFDKREIAALASVGTNLSFQNSQQWLLMGLARASLYFGDLLKALLSKVDELARRDDLHIIHKLHIARFLQNVRENGSGVDSDALFAEVDQPACGFVTRDSYPKPEKSESGFHFDYEFGKHDISALAGLFNVSQGVIEDAIAAEISRLWPGATSLESFTGRRRYDWSSDNRHELYREHIQRHALLNAATRLSKTMPVVVRSYDEDGESRWLDWRERYDVTFKDGAWLADRKDQVPSQAYEEFLGERDGQQETLQDTESVLRKLGLANFVGEGMVPLYAQWTSPDRVIVSISSALADQAGVELQCAEFSGRHSHNLWLPQFWDEGYYDQRGRDKNPFSPLVWSPEAHAGIDGGDEIAALGPCSRPRLGIELTTRLGLANVSNGEWQSKDGNVALRSQVWGTWQPDSDNRRNRSREDGEILWAAPAWLDSTLNELNQRLVITVTLQKYKSSREYDPTSGVKLVLVGLREGDGTFRIWYAKKASKQEY